MANNLDFGFELDEDDSRDSQITNGEMTEQDFVDIELQTEDTMEMGTSDRGLPV